MDRADVKDDLRTLAFSAALVLAGELVVQLAGGDRLWVLLAALAIGFSARAALRSARRGRARSGPAAL